MTARSADASGRFIWATRGRTWGFRFLRRGGLNDPLAVYDAAFSQLGDQPEAWHRGVHGTALRFPDPDGRRDVAGRVIPHELVLLGPTWAEQIDSLEEGRERVWKLIADEFASVWDEAEPPSGRD